MDRWLALLLLPVLLAGCTATRTVNTPPDPLPPQTATLTGSVGVQEAGCPPPPPGPTHSMPAPMYVQFGVREENPSTEPGKPVHFTAYLKNVASFVVTLDQQTPALALRSEQQGGTETPLWRSPLTTWAGIKLQPGQEVTQAVEWPGGKPGNYSLTFDLFHYTVACTSGSPTTGGGGTWVHVLLPAGQALVRTLTPRPAITVDSITMRVDEIVMAQTGTKITLWVSRIQAPAELKVTTWQDGQTILGGSGLGNRDAAGGGVTVFLDRAPVPVGTHSLTIEVSDIGITTPGVGMTYDHGPWRITVPLDPAP